METDRFVLISHYSDRCLSSLIIPSNTCKYHYCPQTKLREGNVFTAVCSSFCSRGNVCGRGCAWQGVCMVGGA